MSLVLDKPYQFMPPHRGLRWPTFIQWTDLYTVYLKRHDGIESHEVRNIELLKASIRAGHGILMVPNHCRTADPLCMGYVSRAAESHVYGMASWHLFNVSRFQTWVLQKIGAFSVLREGLDRQAIDLSIEVLTTAERPLIIFAEGASTRTNDHLHPLMDGISFITRKAAERRVKVDPQAQVLVHPVAIKYVFRGDIERAADDVLTKVEQRLSWQPQRQLPLRARLCKVGLALLAIKELEILGSVQVGSLATRLEQLIDALLGPLERQWLGKADTGAVLPRAKNLRTKLVPDIIAGRLSTTELEQRKSHLAAIDLAQQLSFYPPEYLEGPLYVDRVLETLERLEEDLEGRARRHGSLHVILEVGPALTVSPQRTRAATRDPLIDSLEESLRGMMAKLSQESAIISE